MHIAYFYLLLVTCNVNEKRGTEQYRNFTLDNTQPWIPTLSLREKFSPFYST